MKDLLGDAASALREEGKSDDSQQRFTRARVMASLHQGTVKRRTRLAFVLPIAATFVATSAWGVSSGRAIVWIEEIRTVFGFPSEPAPPAEAPKARATKKAPRLEAKPEKPVDEVVPAIPTPEPVPEETAKPAPERVPVPASAAPDAGLDAELELYRTAHRAHFTERDSTAALAAWDAYLGKAPKGRFVLEARYNRALCLVRLDRKAEARKALEPFARGAFGDYRKREATELMEVLGN
jgi:hypothetical protein